MLQARRTVFFIFLFALFLNGVWVAWSAYKRNFIDSTKKQFCGKLFAKISSIEHHKSSSSNEFIFVVDFENRGRRDLEVTASTYVSHKEGDRVCFTLAIDENSRNITLMEILNGINAVASCLILVILAFCLILASCRWFVYGEFDLPE